DGPARLCHRRAGGPRHPPDAHRHAGALRDRVRRRAHRRRARRVRRGRTRDELRSSARFGRVTAPPIRYAADGDIHLAYCTLGDGPLDLVLVHGSMTNLEVLWDIPEYRGYCERLASFARVICFDKRGM